jgi:hypothetical protein
VAQDAQAPRALRRALPLVELSALAVVALLCLVFQARLPGRLPTEADYRAVTEQLQAQLRPGDAVLLFPWWAERARLYLPPEVPVYGYFGSARDDLKAHPRIWVLGQPELPRSGEAAFLESFLPGRTAVGPPVRAGTLALTLYKNGRYRPHRFVATEAFSRARVYLEAPDGTRRPCPFDGRQHRCPGPPHLYVAPEWHESLYEPRRCLWMHPPGGPERLVTEFEGVPGGTGLRLEGGFTFDTGFSRPHLDTVRLGVDDAGTGERLLDMALPQGLMGWQKAERELPPGAPRTVKVWTQVSNPELRHVCLEVFALGAPGEGA